MHPGEFFSELIVWLCNYFDNIDAEISINKVQQFLTDNMDVVHYAYPVVAKYFLQKRGINISTFSRTKTEAFTSEVKDKVDRFYDEYHLLNEELAVNPIYNEQLQ